MKTIFAAFSTLFFSLCLSQNTDSLRDSQEKHLQNIRQLTFGGTNAEAYFSFDNKKLIFQSTRPPYECDQIFVMNADGSDQTLASTGKGLTTCGYIFPDGKGILYASTHGASDNCIPRPDKSKGYVWGVYGAYDIYVANLDGSGTQILSSTPGYDAEATISPKGDKIIFTSTRDGDLELYSMNLDGSKVTRITHDLGYDGGSFFSWDGKRIVYRAYHPKADSEITEYKTLLAEQLVKPSKMEIFVSDGDGKNRKQLTNTATANFAPFFHPDNKRIIYASNMKDPKGRSFHLYIMKDDGTNVEQVTFGGVFNAFPMFSRDGKKVVFVSDRNAKGRYEFNVFLADWVE
ncbi:MAG: PD40 domain-containing protein [Ignavibacteriales bacterium]|nr:PD40 domain-containing protein [Ignavibacteriales bacterium]